VGESLIVLNGLQKNLSAPSSVVVRRATAEFFVESWSRMPNVTVTRRLKFNAAHRVHNPALSDEQNRTLFGKCNNPNGHGHNYTLDVSVSGEIDTTTGYVMDLAKLKAIVEREVVDPVDHHNLNLDVPFMQGIIPTAENLVVAFWRALAPAVSPGRLTRIVLWETDNNYVEYAGD
jgi:6-pyruvoyltetrahydropterin/6-carboxytetrahydropterin synthase